jgi:uncharacterized repeat protein (TIGR01451 family)
VGCAVASRLNGGRRGRGLAIAMILAACAVGVWAGPAFGEGSVDLNTGPDTARRHALNMTGPMATSVHIDRYSVLRVYARAGETIQMGHSAMRLVGFGTGLDNILVFPPGTSFASSTDPSQRAPLGTDPVFATAIFDCNDDDDASAGRIATRAQELAGPAPNPGGYPPCEFVAPADGIYPIIMLPFATFAQAVGGTVGVPITTTLQRGGLSMWDVTVRDADGDIQPGRLFSNRLTFSVGSASPVPASGVSAFLYSPSGHEYRIGFFEHAGDVWDLAADDRGVIDAASRERLFASFQWGDSDIDEDNSLEHTEAVAPLLTAPDLGQDGRFPIFFRRPDPIAISGNEGLAEAGGFAQAPIAPSGAFTSASFAGAGGEAGATLRGSGGTLGFTAPPQMDGLEYTVEIDLNANGSFGDTGDVTATGDLDSAGNAFAWDGRDATGALPACGSYAYRLRATLAEVHLTQSDVETSGGTLIERLSLPGDPALGDPLAASYNDVDPYKGVAITNTSPDAVSEGASGPGFHAWSASTGNADFVDTWMRLPEVSSSGTLEVRCPEPPDNDPPDNEPPTSAPPTSAPPTAPPSGGDQPGESTRKPRLRLRKTVNRARIRAGETATFTIRVSNPSGRVLRNVRVCDPLAAGLVFVQRHAARPRPPRTSLLDDPAAQSRRVEGVETEGPCAVRHARSQEQPRDGHLAQRPTRARQRSDPRAAGTGPCRRRHRLVPNRQHSSAVRAPAGAVRASGSRPAGDTRARLRSHDLAASGVLDAPERIDVTRKARARRPCWLSVDEVGYRRSAEPTGANAPKPHDSRCQNDVHVSAAAGAPR